MTTQRSYGRVNEPIGHLMDAWLVGSVMKGARLRFLAFIS